MALSASASTGRNGEARKDIGGTLNPMVTVCPDRLNAVNDYEWEEAELAVDSGASEIVLNVDMVLSAVVQESTASRKGADYEVANGIRIPNLWGETLPWS